MSARRNVNARTSALARMPNPLPMSATATVDANPVPARMESVTVPARRSVAISVPVVEVN